MCKIPQTTGSTDVLRTSRQENQIQLADLLHGHLCSIHLRDVIDVRNPFNPSFRSIIALPSTKAHLLKPNPQLTFYVVMARASFDNVDRWATANNPPPDDWRDGHRCKWMLRVGWHAAFKMIRTYLTGSPPKCPSYFELRVAGGKTGCRYRYCCIKKHVAHHEKEQCRGALVKIAASV